jgi:hypothetical protein
MDDISVDTNQEMMLDANSVGGLLWDIFGAEMTAEPTECAHCGNQAEIGTLLAYTQGPGVVLRCSTCSKVVLRIVQTPGAVYLDARGAVYLRFGR